MCLARAYKGRPLRVMGLRLALVWANVRHLYGLTRLLCSYMGETGCLDCQRPRLICLSQLPSGSSNTFLFPFVFANSIARARAIFSQFLAVNGRAQTKAKVFFVLTRQLESETIGTIRAFAALQWEIVNTEYQTVESFVFFRAHFLFSKLCKSIN